MKNKKASLIGLLIILGIFLICFYLVLNFRQTKEKVIDKSSAIPVEVKKGTFEYIPSFENSSVEDVYYYSDSYFEESGQQKNEHLRTMSICLALSASTSIDKETQSENVKNLLEDLEFENIVIDDLNKEPSADSIGSAIASRKIEDKTLIAVAIRGSNYLNEWESNFTAGKNGDMKGFSNAAQTMLDRIQNYQKKYGINSCKLWIVGYSRSGAVANLMGKYINESMEDFQTTVDDIYVYTFEAPLASSSDVVYKNIHNVINPNDFITYVYPKKWGLSNNGVEELIGDSSQEIVKQEWNIFNGKLTDSVNKDGDAVVVETREFLDDFVSWLTKNNRIVDYAISREKYVAYLEKPLVDMVELYFSKTKEEREEIFEFFSQVYQEFIEDAKINEIFENFSDLQNLNFDKEEIFGIIKDYIEVAFEASSVPLTEEELKIIEDSVISVSEIALPLLIVSFFDGDNTLEFDMEMTGFYHFATLIYHFPEIIHQHYTQTNLKLVQAEDSYYQK